MDQNCKLILGNCFEKLEEIANGSLNLVIIDPPYYKIKQDDWDNNWKTLIDYLDWIEKICILIKKKLAKNGSFDIFADDERVSYIQIRLDKHFTFLNHLVWFKPNNLSLKYASAHRKFAPMSERILFYCVEDKTGLERINEEFIKPRNSFSKYLKNELKRANISNIEVAKLFPSKAGGLTGCVSNWLNGDNIITKEQYLKLRNFLNKENSCEYLQKVYEDLRKEYYDLRKQYEDQRRTFNFQNGIHEIISEPIIQKKENTIHSTTKPVRVIEHLIKASSNKGDIVLDCFMGSGTTGVAALKLQRKFIGIEINQEYFEIAKKRIAEWQHQTRL